MNKYGTTASNHWQSAAPQMYAQLDNPKEFFSTLGEQVEARVIDLQKELAGPDPTGEAYLDKVGRLNMARTRAEEIALEELVWLPGALEEPDDEPTAWDKAMHQAWQNDQDDQQLQ